MEKTNTYKYIIFEENYIIIFPRFIPHKEIAERLRDKKVVSAGFVDFGLINCHGESKDIGAKAQEDDVLHIRCF